AINVPSGSVATTLLMVMVVEAAGAIPIHVGSKHPAGAVHTPPITSGSLAKFTYSSLTAYCPAGRLAALAYQSLRLTCAVNVLDAVVMSARSGDPSANEIGRPSGIRSAGISVVPPAAVTRGMRLYGVGTTA